MPYKSRAVQIEYQRLWIKRRRENWLKEHGPCAECGSWDDLEVDHIHPEAKVDHKVWSWAAAKREPELAKCQILCKPCHLKKTIAASQKNGGHNTNGYDRGCRCAICTAAKRDKSRRYTYKNRLAATAPVIQQ